MLLYRARDVREACSIGLQLTPTAIGRETGCAIAELVSGLLPGLLMMAAVVGITTAVGGLAGAAVGALFGGVGAAPGAALGVEAGVSVGMALLGWLGLGFLAVSMGRGLADMSVQVLQALSLAWNAHGTSNQQRDIQRAGQTLADAVASLFKLILMAIVARLTLNPALGATKLAAARSTAALDELVVSLRSSRLGGGFADWVAANAPALLRNPKLQAPAPPVAAAAVERDVVVATKTAVKKPVALESRPAPAPAGVSAAMEVKLTAEQAENIRRFEKKLPANAKDSVSVKQLPNGGVAVQGISPGRVPGSSAVYEKQIDAAGNTIQATKTTYDPGGNIVHVKDKLNGGVLP